MDETAKESKVNAHSPKNITDHHSTAGSMFCGQSLATQNLQSRGGNKVTPVNTIK